jgi:hypothetical protein
MPRPRKQTALDETVLEIVNAAARQIIQAVRQSIADEIASVARGDSRFTLSRGRKTSGGPRRGPAHCVYPGCNQPHKGPRFSFLCDEHRNITAAEKTKLKAAKTTGKGGERKAKAAAKARRRATPRASSKARR